MEKVKSRRAELPSYTKGEERFNWISHCAGAALSIAGLVIGIVFAALFGNVWSVVSVSVYGTSMIVLYTISTIYHSLPKSNAKRVFRVLDHCSIFLLIAGTYTPFTLITLRSQTSWIGWAVFGTVWGVAIIGIILNAIDLKRFSKISMALYISMGWCILITARLLMRGIEPTGLALLAIGGAFYTLGAIVYAVGKKVKYLHATWHLFVVAGSSLHFFTIIFFVLDKV